CKDLVEIEKLPLRGEEIDCPSCKHRFVWSSGTASRNRYRCSCGHVGQYPAELRESGPPRHRVFAIEYHCPRCKPGHKGRFFKCPDKEDLKRFTPAEQLLNSHHDLVFPEDEIPDGDETKRLHRWGYH